MEIHEDRSQIRTAQGRLVAAVPDRVIASTNHQIRHVRDPALTVSGLTGEAGDRDIGQHRTNHVGCRLQRWPATQ
jgi:hypothetical protein